MNLSNPIKNKFGVISLQHGLDSDMDELLDGWFSGRLARQVYVLIDIPLMNLCGSIRDEIYQSNI